MGSRVSIQEWRPSINYAIQSERTQDLRKFKQGKIKSRYYLQRKFSCKTSRFDYLLVLSKRK